MKTSPHISPSKKRSGVKELVGALLSNGVSIDDIVVERDNDGAVRVYKRPKRLENKLSELEMWEKKRAAS